MSNNKVYLCKIEEFYFFYESNYNDKKIVRYLSDDGNEGSRVGFIYINEKLGANLCSEKCMPQLYKKAFDKIKRLNLFMD